MESAHVLGALLAKFDKAVREKQNEVTVWGSGQPRREFLFVDDFVKAALLLMEKYDGEEFLNVGSGSDVSIKELAERMAKATGFQGRIHFDSSKPDGAAQKLLDNAKIRRLGWKPAVSLKDGIQKTYDWHRGQRNQN